MSDPNPNPNPNPAPEPDPTPRKRGEVNQEWLGELINAESVSAAAKKPDRAATLAEGGIDAGKTAALDAAIAGTRKLISNAVQGTHGKTEATGDETNFETALIHKIQEVQKRARQKYDATDPDKLADYAIGARYYGSRPALEQAAVNILAKIAPQPLPGGGTAPPLDVLPGISAAKIAALQQAAKDYAGGQGGQTDAQSIATTARKLVEAGIADVLAKRREIQFAADADWPHTDPANAGIRAEFLLPPDRVMK